MARVLIACEFSGVVRRDKAWSDAMAGWLEENGCPACGAKVEMIRRHTLVTFTVAATCGWVSNIRFCNPRKGLGGALYGHCRNEPHDSFPAMRRLEAMIDRQVGEEGERA